MKFTRAIINVLATILVFALLGAGIGSALGQFMPEYYRNIFPSGHDPQFEPLSVGLGQGLTQGTAAGAVIGLALVANCLKNERNKMCYRRILWHSPTVVPRTTDSLIKRFNRMNSVSLLVTTLVLVFVIHLDSRRTFGQQPSSAEELKTLVKEFAFASKPGLNPTTQFAIEEYSIDGLKALKLQILHVQYLAPDGTQFNEALLLCRDGKLLPFANSLGGHGLMSAVVSNDKLYYTYSFGSGQHRSHLAQLSVVNGKLTFAESGPLLDLDYFIIKDGNKLRLERGKFEKFNMWKADKKIGEIMAKDSGFAVVDEKEKEVKSFASQNKAKNPEKK